MDNSMVQKRWSNHVIRTSPGRQGTKTGNGILGFWKTMCLSQTEDMMMQPANPDNQEKMKEGKTRKYI